MLSDSCILILGVTLDTAVTFDKHITNVTRCCHYHIRALRHIRPLLTLDTAKTIAASIVGSRLDYCNSLLYGMSQANIDRLQRAQNVLARVVAQAPSTISSADIRRNLHWLPINHGISYKLSLLTWKALYTAEPSYLSELISPYVPARTLTFLQHVPSINTNGCYKSLLLTLFFCFRTVNVELFTSTYSLYKLSTFKRQLKSHFF